MTKTSEGKTRARVAKGKLARRRDYPRWRAISLSLVYVAFAVHIIHWRMKGKTLAPLELNEVMYTLELGIITAGFLFMCLLVFGTLLFGRFFCSWACHIMVLQDLCAWLLAKVGIRAKPIRSRLLLLVPPLTAFYMFLWPQLVRMWESRSLPTFHLATDRDGWASLVTDNFWRNLPGPWIIALTFLVCGFLMVYLLGSRSFCTYVCPYGAVFGLADRFSPGRVLVNDSCQQCGRCTAVCKTGVRVHEEVNSYGKVVNPACLKCLDCVTVCPQRALRYGWGGPALFQSYAGFGRFGLPYELSVREEILAALVCGFALLAFRGLYGRVPFLLSLALGAILGYLAVVSVRLTRRPAVRLADLQLKQAGRLTITGRISAAVFTALGLLVLHSARVRWHEYNGLKGTVALRTTAPSERPIVAATAQRHLLAAKRWGLMTNEHIERALISTAAEALDFEAAAAAGARYLERYPDDHRIRLTLGRALLRLGRDLEAEQQLRRIVDPRKPASGPPDVMTAAYDELATTAARRGDFPAAAAFFRESMALTPGRGTVHADLGGVLAELGHLDAAIESLQEAVRLDPALGQAAYNLGTLLAHTGRPADAIEYYEKAIVIIPDDPDLRNNFGSALLSLERWSDAEPHLRRAVELAPQHADAHFNLARVLNKAGRPADAVEHLQIAAELDSRYDDLMKPAPAVNAPATSGAATHR